MSDVECNWYKEACQNDASSEHRADVDGGLNVNRIPYRLGATEKPRSR
jgi:hypothetical protein